jgi:hypothetical protein
MYEQKGLPNASKISKAMSTDSSRDESHLDEVENKEIPNESDGSIGSHLMYGLGTLVFVLPMLLPGIPIKWLAEFYVGLIVLGIVGYMLWSALSALKTRWQRRH